MPKGDSPNSRANLKPFSARTEKEQRELQSKGGKASGEARAFRKKLCDDLRDQCTPESLHKMNERLIRMAEHGNLKAYELIRDALGEKPQNRIEIDRRQDDMHRMDKLLIALNMLADPGTD